jgi:hypothetical protein
MQINATNQSTQCTLTGVTYFPYNCNQVQTLLFTPPTTGTQPKNVAGTQISTRCWGDWSYGTEGVNCSNIATQNIYNMSGITQGFNIIDHKFGTGDYQGMNERFYANAGVNFASDQGVQAHFLNTGQYGWWGKTGGVTIVSATAVSGGTSLVTTFSSPGCYSDDQQCYPSTDTYMLDITNGGPVAQYLSSGSSSWTSSPCYQSYIQAVTTNASFTPVTACGTATGSDSSPNTTVSNPIAQRVTFTSGTQAGTFPTTGLPYTGCLMGNEYTEQVKITAVSGSSTAQTVTYYSFRPNTTVVLFAGSCFLQSADGTYVAGGTRTTYPSITFDATTLLYTYGSFGENINNTLGYNDNVVFAPAYNAATNYLVGTYVSASNGYTFQVTANPGVGGTVPTWTSTVGNSVNSGNGVTFTNVNYLTRFHLYKGALVNTLTTTKTVGTQTVIDPNYQNLGPNDTAWHVNDVVESPDFGPQVINPYNTNINVTSAATSSAFAYGHQMNWSGLGISQNVVGFWQRNANSLSLYANGLVKYPTECFEQSGAWLLVLEIDPTIGGNVINVHGFPSGWPE